MCPCRCTLKPIQRSLSLRRNYRPGKRAREVPAEPLLTPKLYDASPRTIEDFITPSRIALLEQTLSPYLPEFAPPTKPLSSLSSPSLSPGYHFVFFPTSTSEKDTLADGYEKHFAPVHPYARRLWVSGRLKFSGSGLAIGEPATCEEDLFATRVEKDRWTTITIRRRMFTPEFLDTDYVEEERTLRYLRDVSMRNNPVKVLDKQDMKRNWKDEKLLVDHTFTPTRILLTRFSFLTYNFHRIHLDKEYAHNVEEWPDLLVHGNLSIVLALTTIRKYYESKGKDLQIQNARYMMLRPLFVDQRIRITITNVAKTRKRVILWSKEGKAVEVIIGHQHI